MCVTSSNVGRIAWSSTRWSLPMLTSRPVSSALTERTRASDDVHGQPTNATLTAIEIAKRCGDTDLWAFAVLGLGQALIALSDTVGGAVRLDEVMVSVTAGEVGPVTSGIVYGAVILERDQQAPAKMTAPTTRHPG